MTENNHNEIEKILNETATFSKCCTLPLLINICKKEGISKKDVLSTIEKLMRKGDIYKIPESICLLT